MLYQLKTIGDHVGVLATAMLLLSGVAEAMRVAILETAIAKRDSPPPADPTFINTALNAVNTIRVQHDAANLTWDADLAAIALTKANGCTLNHTGDYGENAYYFWFKPATRKPNFTAQTQAAFDAWVGQDEVDAYLAGNLIGGGHFTQTVWKSSQTLGCAFSTNYCAQNPKKEWWFYCDFFPAGNVIDQYEDNVTV